MVAQLTPEDAAPIVNELPHQMQVSLLRRMKKIGSARYCTI